ncbi:hypothetical protein [Streptomyces deserti]
MEQVGDKPEEVRKHFEEEQQKRSPDGTESGDEGTEWAERASEEGASASATDEQDSD